MKPDNMISSLKRPLPRTARRRPLARRSRIRERAIHRHWGDCWRIIDPNLEKREPCKPRLGMRPRLHCEEMAFQRDNHYVSCLYLKRFAASPGRVWTYRTLVAHSPHKPPDGPFQTSSHQGRSRLSSSVPSPANIMRLKKCVVIF